MSWNRLHDGHWKSAYSWMSTGADDEPWISESFGPSWCLGTTTFEFSVPDRDDWTMMPTTSATTTTPITIHHCSARPSGPAFFAGRPPGEFFGPEVDGRFAGRWLPEAIYPFILSSRASAERGPSAMNTERPSSTTSRTISSAYWEASKRFVTPPPPKHPQSIDNPRAQAEPIIAMNPTNSTADTHAAGRVASPMRSRSARASSTNGSPQAIGLTNASGNSS